ncbi:hypothetical protein GCM10022211_11790 [Sphingomonas humi]|uniref:Uncharacterized protein n=1 Tax=Sphingomonas humi TaxID=335630 RepID=A0ABP7RTY5_9SPHN
MRQPDATNKQPYYVSRLVALSVNGRKPSARLLHEVRSKVDGLGQVLRISTRCQDTPAQGVLGVLNVSYWDSYEQRVTIELRP